MKIHTAIFLLMVAFTTYGNYKSSIPDSTFLSYADSLFNSTSDSSTHVRIIRKKHTYFLVTTCKTFQIPYDHIISALEKIDSYKDYFKFMKRSEFVYGDSIVDSTALFEVGVAFYVAWYVGCIQKVNIENAKECRLICGNVDQRYFRKQWEGKLGGLIKIRSHDVYLEWRIRDEGMGQSRIALTVSQAPAVYIPGWLLKIASTKLFPGMIVELEKALENNDLTK